MDYGKFDTFCCTNCFLLIFNELSCIDPGNQLVKITNTMNIITILQSSNFNVFLHGSVPLHRVLFIFSCNLK